MIEQVANVCQTTIALDAWERDQELTVHGWIYGLQDGLLRDLNVTVGGADETFTIYQAAIAALAYSKFAGYAFILSRRRRRRTSQLQSTFRRSDNTPFAVVSFFASLGMTAKEQSHLQPTAHRVSPRPRSIDHPLARPHSAPLHVDRADS